jgi:hypothetical protein
MGEANVHTTQIPGGWLRAYAADLFTRLGLSHALGSTHQGERDIEAVLGYKAHLTYQDFKHAYLRYDLAQRLVNAYPEDTWAQFPTVREDDEEAHDTQFEQDWKTLVKRLDLQTQLPLADVQANLGHYSILLIGLRNQPNLSLPAEPVHGVNDVMFLQRYSEEFVTIEAFGTDASRPDYQRPVKYLLHTGVTPSDLLRRPNYGVQGTLVDASRVIHIPGEYRLDDDIYGLPVLEAVYNKLVDLLKVVGGSAEMFWRDAKRRITITQQDGFRVDPDVREQMKEDVENFQHGLKDFLGLEGYQVQALAGTVANPREHFNILIQSIAGTCRYPQRVLLGTEEGKLAGVKDDSRYLSRVGSRQVRYAEPTLLRALIDRLIQFGALRIRVPDYTVDWGALHTLSEAERAAIAKDWAAAFTAYAGPGMADSVVTREEFRVLHAGLPEVPELGTLVEVAPVDETLTPPAVPSPAPAADQGPAAGAAA